MSSTTEQLIEAARGGDKSAFAELIRRYERAAWVAAWRVLREHHATLDATQIAFVEAYCKLSQLRSPGRFGMWLMRIAHRAALQIARQSPTTCSLDQVEPSALATRTASSLEQDELLTAVANLPAHERLVVVLRYFQGLSVEEVAQGTGRPVGTVTKQLSRALGRLKTLLGRSIADVS